MNIGCTYKGEGTLCQMPDFTLAQVGLCYSVVVVF